MYESRRSSWRVADVSSRHRACGRGAAEARPRRGDAYSQFLLGHHLDETDDEDGAIAAYKKAMELDPTAAEIPGDCRPCTCARTRPGSDDDGRAGAEDRARRTAKPTACSASSTPRCRESRGRAATRAAAGHANASRDLDQPVVGAEVGSQRARDAGAALRRRAAIRQGHRHTHRPRGRAAGMAGRSAAPGAGLRRRRPERRRINWLQDRARGRSTAAADARRFLRARTPVEGCGRAYGRAVEQSPRNNDLRARYASALVNAGGKREPLKARDLLATLTSSRPGEQSRILYLLSQTQRRLGDFKAAEETARRVIAQSCESPWGYYALAEALEGRRDFQGVVTELAPIVARVQRQGDRAGVRRRPAAAAPRLCLPGAGPGRQGRRDLRGGAPARAERRERRRRILPTPTSPPRSTRQRSTPQRRVSSTIPDDLRLVRLAGAGAASHRESRSGRRHPRGVRSHARATTRWRIWRWPSSTATSTAARRRFACSRTRRRNFPATTRSDSNWARPSTGRSSSADAEAAFKQLIARDPENAPALNYLGYMLAERGERLDESVGYVKKALEIEPDNGSYLDSASAGRTSRPTSSISPKAI